MFNTELILWYCCKLLYLNNSGWKYTLLSCESMLSSLRQLPNLQFYWPAEYFQNIFSDEDTIIALPLRDTFPKVSETFDGETDTPGINPLVFSGRLPKRFSQKKRAWKWSISTRPSALQVHMRLRPVCLDSLRFMGSRHLYQRLLMGTQTLEHTV